MLQIFHHYFKLKEILEKFEGSAQGDSVLLLLCSNQYSLTLGFFDPKIIPFEINVLIERARTELCCLLPPLFLCEVSR